MSYIGKVDMNDANIKHYSLTGSTLTVIPIGWTPASEQSLRVTINGVVQQGDTFSYYSGSNLTLGGPLVVTDTLEVVGIESVGNIITPADNSVTTTKLADDAVTLAKMAGGTDGNLITYDASGDPAYVATGAATNILTSNGAGAAPTFQAAAAGGLTAASQWRLNTSFTSSAEPIASNLEEVDAPVGFGVLGSSMTESLGLFTFPSTGYWFIQFHTEWSTPNNNPWMYSRIYTTTDDSTYTLAAQGNSYGKTDSSQIVYTNANTSYIFDVTSTSTHKIRFDIVVYDANITTVGATNDNRTCMTFLRLADRP
jgi:hypothetical protein